MPMETPKKRNAFRTLGKIASLDFEGGDRILLADRRNVYFETLDALGQIRKFWKML